MTNLNILNYFFIVKYDGKHDDKIEFLSFRMKAKKRKKCGRMVSMSFEGIGIPKMNLRHGDYRFPNDFQCYNCGLRLKVEKYEK